jgi:hypothetical protein
MFIEIQAAYLVLSKWKQNPAVAKREIGLWAHWRDECEDNRRPLSSVEVEQLKTLLRRHAPASYSKLFVGELNLPDARS